MILRSTVEDPAGPGEPPRGLEVPSSPSLRSACGFMLGLRPACGRHVPSASGNSCDGSARAETRASLTGGKKTMVKAKRARWGCPADAIDVVYYNQILEVLRQQQETGSVYYGSFVYEPRSVYSEPWAGALLYNQHMLAQHLAATNQTSPQPTPLGLASYGWANSQAGGGGWFSSSGQKTLSNPASSHPGTGVPSPAPLSGATSTQQIKRLSGFNNLSRPPPGPPQQHHQPSNHPLFQRVCSPSSRDGGEARPSFTAASAPAGAGGGAAQISSLGSGGSGSSGSGAAGKTANGVCDGHVVAARPTQRRTPISASQQQERRAAAAAAAATTAAEGGGSATMIGSVGSESGQKKDRACSPDAKTCSSDSEMYDFPAAKEAANLIEAARERLGEDPKWRERLMVEMEASAVREKALANNDEKHGPFSEEEDALVLVGRFICGNKWSNVAKAIAGRTASAIKKHWHSTLKEKYRRAGWCSRLLSPPLELVRQPPAEKRTSNPEPSVTAIEDSEGKAPQESEEEAPAREAEAMQAAMRTGDKAAMYAAYHMHYLRNLKPCENRCMANGGTVATEDDHSRSSPNGGAVPPRGMAPADGANSAEHGQGEDEDLVDHTFQLDNGGVDSVLVSKDPKLPAVPTDGPVDTRKQGKISGKGGMKQGSSSGREGQKQGPLSARKSSKQGASGRRSAVESMPLTGLERHQAFPLVEDCSRKGSPSLQEVGKRGMMPDREGMKQSLMVRDPAKTRAVNAHDVSMLGLLTGHENSNPAVAGEVGGEDQEEVREDVGECEDGESAVQFCKAVDGEKFVWSRERVFILFRTMREHSVLAMKKSGGVTSAKKWDYVREVTQFPLTATQLENKYRNLRKPYVKYCEVDEETRRRLKMPPFCDIMSEFLGPLSRDSAGRGALDSSIAGSDNEEEDIELA